MSEEIIINTEEEQTRIAILEGGTLAEFHVEDADNARTLGDIYLGRVRRIVPSIRAAFVDIGLFQDAFLPFADLDENLEVQLGYVQSDSPHLQANPPTLTTTEKGQRTRRRYGSPDLLRQGQPLLVQVVKEPFSTKGTQVSTRLALAGRFIVLIPIARFVAVSRRVGSRKERTRLRNVARGLRPNGFGIIVRTVAQGKSRHAIKTDLEHLLKRWHRVETSIAKADGVPQKVHADQGMTVSIVRDLFSSDYDRILVDTPQMYGRIRRYVQAIAPNLVQAVQLYKGARPIFEETGIQSSVDDVSSRKVDLESGGHLVIEETEAMHVIDVNSGTRRGKRVGKERYMLTTNLEAARMIVRQVRLRDLGGTIVVDFINMIDAKNCDRVYRVLKEGFASDRAATDIYPMTPLGLIQITRQRTRSAAKSPDDAEQSKGQAAVLSPRELVASMEAWLGTYHHNGSGRKLLLHVHPFTAAYLNRGFYNLRLQWWVRHGVRIVLKEEPGMQVMNYRFETFSKKALHHNGRKPSSHKTGEMLSV